MEEKNVEKKFEEGNKMKEIDLLKKFFEAEPVTKVDVVIKDTSYHEMIFKDQGLERHVTTQFIRTAVENGYEVLIRKAGQKSEDDE